jgi:hypothetical protein
MVHAYGAVPPLAVNIFGDAVDSVIVAGATASGTAVANPQKSMRIRAYFMVFSQLEH